MGERAGFVVQLEVGVSLYYGGDSALFGDLGLMCVSLRPAFAFLPIGDLFTKSPREPAKACRLLKPKQVKPMHFGTFPPLTGRPEQLAELIADLPTKVLTLEPGKPVNW